MNSKEYFEVKGDYLVRGTELAENVFREEVVMNKQAFVECYNKWIKNNDKSEWIPTDFFHDVYRCSKCGIQITVSEESELPDECPNCYAKMEINND